MKKRSIIFSPILLVLFTLIMLLNYGCSEDFFNQKAGDRITPYQHYKTLDDGLISLSGAIIPLQDIMPRLIILDGLRSDEMDVNPWADAYFKNLNENILSGDNPFTNIADLYKVIININEVLANLDRIGEKDRDYDAVISHQLKGALIGMRSWTYLTIARLTGGAIYIADNLTSLPSNFEQHLPIPKNDLLDTLVNQLTPYIHDPLQTFFVELWVNNYVNNKALLGEIYLEKNDYENAVKFLKMACESYGNSTVILKVDRTHQNAGWRSIFLNAETQTVENKSVIPFSSRNNQNNPLANWFNFDHQVKPSNVLVDSFLVQVPAAGNPGDLWRGQGVSILVDTIGQVSENTYLTNSFITKYAVDINDPQSSDIIISRAADMHLLLAEALNRTGDPAAQNWAMLLVNNGFNSISPRPAAYVRWNANLGVRGRVFLRPRLVPVDLTGEDRMLFIEDLIMAERALELAFEGKRWNDLVRIARRRNDPSFLADRVAAKFFGTPQYEIVKNRLLNPENWYIR